MKTTYQLIHLYLLNNIDKSDIELESYYLENDKIIISYYYNNLDSNKRIVDYTAIFVLDYITFLFNIKKIIIMKKKKIN